MRLLRMFLFLALALLSPQLLVLGGHAEAQQASDMRNIVRRKLTGYVGFANLPNQWHRKSVRKGFNFNVMVVGMLGLPRVIHPYLTNHR